MKPLLFAIALTAVSLAGCRDDRVAPLEQRIAHLEQTVAKLELQNKKSGDDETERRDKLQMCVHDANYNYDTAIQNNGTKNRNGTYTVDVRVQNQLLRLKQDKIEECKLLYAK
jgi:hypothetical protein